MIEISEEQIVKLLLYVHSKLLETPCDHSLKFSLQWAKQNRLNPMQFTDFLEEHGGFCDCEVVTNVPEDMSLDLDLE